MKTRAISLALALIMALALFSACSPKASEPEVDTSTPVTLRVVSAWEDFPALQTVAGMFSEKYSNCTIEYEYLQDYYASLEKRLASGEDTIDIFVTTNLQDGSALLPYALDLYSAPEIDFSQTFEGLMRNFEYRDADASAAKQLYAVPLGAEIRGMYVNTTLLKSLGLKTPTNATELLEACKTLADKGYIPMQGNPGLFAQQLMYPYCANIIANADDYEKIYGEVNSRAAGASELFLEPMRLMYELVENNFYNYKLVENDYGMFTETSNESYARYFLNIVEKDGKYEKADDVGTVAFMPFTMSAEGTIAKTKSDYHSGIEYEFILSPVGEKGGYAYMSPAHGIAINKASANLEWAERFIGFLFQPEVNEAFADKHAIIPNTADAFAQIEERFSVPESHISHLGEVTFDYDFYKEMTASLVEVAKANNPKYMQTDASGAQTLYDFDHFMENLELRLTGQMPEE